MGERANTTDTKKGLGRASIVAKVKPARWPYWTFQ